MVLGGQQEKLLTAFVHEERAISGGHGRDKQVTALQLRLQALHASTLLTTKGTDCLEDVIEDAKLEQAGEADGTKVVSQMTAVSERWYVREATSTEVYLKMPPAKQLRKRMRSCMSIM